MDINNTPYFLLRTPEEFSQASVRLQWHPLRQALTLAQNQQLRLPQSSAAVALAAWDAATPLALDDFGQIGRLSADRSQVEFNSGGGFLPLQDVLLNKVRAPAGTFLDMNLNSHGLLALPFSDAAEQHGLLLFHLGKRWQTQCPLPEAAPGLDRPGGTHLVPRGKPVDGVPGQPPATALRPRGNPV